MFIQIYEKFKYLCRLIYKKNKPMRCFKTMTRHYNRDAVKYVGFEYDLKTDMTFFIQKIIGTTKVFGEAHEFEGDKSKTYEKEFVGKAGYTECSREEFEKYPLYGDI